MKPKIDEQELRKILAISNPAKRYEALILFAEITALAYGKELLNNKK